MSKASGKTYTSKGERKNINTKLLNSIKSDELPAIEQINIQKAWLAGQNPWVTLDNPNKENTKERKIKRKANDLWGNPKERDKNMFIMK
jgi:hypothetical protein